MGFVSPYAGSQTREDFVETIANFIVKTDAQWNTILSNAEKGWKFVYSEDSQGNKITTIVETTDTDGVNGKTVILQKLSICKEWLKNSWNINLDALRQEVQTRQANINMTVLLNPIKK